MSPQERVAAKLREIEARKAAAHTAYNAAVRLLLAASADARYASGLTDEQAIAWLAKWGEGDEQLKARAVCAQFAIEPLPRLATTAAFCPIVRHVNEADDQAFLAVGSIRAERSRVERDLAETADAVMRNFVVLRIARVRIAEEPDS